jgi:hypothetical protein
VTDGSVWRPGIAAAAVVFVVTAVLEQVLHAEYQTWLNSLVLHDVSGIVLGAERSARGLSPLLYDPHTLWGEGAYLWHGWSLCARMSETVPPPEITEEGETG